VPKSTPTALVLAALAALAFTQHATAQQFRFERGDPRAGVEGKRASCEVYAKIAGVQTDANRKYRCGLRGPRWTDDALAHFRWCRFVSRSAIRDEQRERAKALQECFDRLGDFDERD
jgi:hypothetical protein